MDFIPESSAFYRLFRLLYLDRKDIWQVYGFALFNGLVSLSLPIGIQAIINLIQGGVISTAWIIMVIFVLVGTLSSGIFQLLQLRIVENIAQRLFVRSAFEFTYRIPNIRNTELRNHHTPELANRFFDTLTIQKSLPKLLIDLSVAIFQIITGLIVLSIYHPFFIVYGLISIGGIIVMIRITGPSGLKTSLQESKYKYQVAGWLEEVARTRLSFKFVAEPQIALKRTDGIVKNYLHARESHFKILLRHFTSLVGFKLIITAGLLIIGSVLVFNQQMNIGQFVAAEIIIIIIIASIEKLMTSIDSIYDILTALEKIGFIADMSLDKDYGKGIELVTGRKGVRTELVSVSFGYPEKAGILDEVSLELSENESLVVSGSSGSGKSTLLAILGGLRQPDSGVVLYNNLSLSTLKFASFKKHVGFLFSNNQLFHGTIADNIGMGREEIKLAELLESIKISGLTDFIKNLPDGLETTVDPEARRLPRNVSSRILLARAIAHKPKLLLLEDPLSDIPQDERESLIAQLTNPNNPWNIIVTTNEPLWLKYIQHHVILDNGQLNKII